MKGDKHTFIHDSIFHKQYTKDEYYYLKMLHDSTRLEIDTITTNNTEYITMPEGIVISIDTIPKNAHSTVRSIITKNIPFMLEQIRYIQSLNIYYSDCLQWLYYNKKLYLIDFDIAYIGVDRDHNNYELLSIFLGCFDVDSSFIESSLNYLWLFQKGTNRLMTKEQIELYNKLNNDTMQKNHIYYSNNRRHIQVNINNIRIYSDNGNYIITEVILNPELQKEWELIRIV